MRQQNQREKEILDAIVRLNIETGQPVSSGLVARYLSQAYSSATIRAVMKRLEKQGFLLQPHTSAGRLPTDKGFRAFVDRVLSSWPLQAYQPPRRLRRLVEADLKRSLGSHTMIKVLAALLSKLTANISIILGPSWAEIRALRVDLYPKEGRSVLMVLVLENALVRSGQFSMNEDYPRPILEEAARLLSERISGLTVAEIRSGALSSIATSTSSASRCAADLARCGRDLFRDVEEGEIELEGVANVLNEPEFSEPEPLKALIRFIESPRTIRDSLQRLSQESAGGLGIWIGQENPIGELRTFSLLSTSFNLAGRRGILAVLGPRRMPYPRAFSGINVLRQTLQYLS